MKTPGIEFEIILFENVASVDSSLQPPGLCPPPCKPGTAGSVRNICSVVLRGGPHAVGMEIASK